MDLFSTAASPDRDPQLAGPDALNGDAALRRKPLPSPATRLGGALRLLGRVGVLADIGCDHGRFGVLALRAGLAERVIASDVSAPSLEKARVLARREGLQHRFVFHCCSGFSKLSPGEADAAVLLGMGGELIADILNDGAKTAHSLMRIVMQPMRGEAELRRFLHENGYLIEDEAVAFEGGRGYQLIAARFLGPKPIPLPEGFPDGYYQFGALAVLRRDELLLPMMERYLSIINKKLEKAKKCGKLPPTLVREAQSTERLIELYNQTPNGKVK